MFYVSFKTGLKLLSFVLCCQCQELNQEQTVKEGIKNGLESKCIPDIFHVTEIEVNIWEKGNKVLSPRGKG